MIESSDVLSLMKVVYLAYMLIVLSLLGAYTHAITRREKIQPRFRVSFYAWLGLLVFTGVGIHVLTFNKLPWVKWDLTRDSIAVDREYRIMVADYKFHLPDERLVINKGQTVRFNLESRDYTYGFGLFRADGSMVFQMQVVPGSRNDIVWKFDKSDTYSIRSTEYSGPRGGDMLVKDAVVITPDIAVTQAETGA